MGKPDETELAEGARPTSEKRKVMHPVPVPHHLVMEELHPPPPPLILIPERPLMYRTSWEETDPRTGYRRRVS